MLLDSIGEKSENIFTSLNSAKRIAKKYEVVIKRFEYHFFVKKNKRYERSNFNKRTQGENQSAESFITSVHQIAETCEYDNLRKELICDRSNLGIRDQKFTAG